MTAGTVCSTTHGSRAEGIPCSSRLVTVVAVEVFFGSIVGVSATTVTASSTVATAIVARSDTLSWNEVNAEGPVNTDTNFGDTGRTENFDDPFVNFGGYGPLANDHRHQIKLRGTYALNDNWRVGATLDARSGGPITGFGVGNPYNWKLYHSYYVCVENCTPPDGAQEGDTWSTSDRVYEHSARGGYGRMPWIIDFGTSLTYERAFGPALFRAKLAVYNLFNDQKPVWVYQDLESSVGERDEFFGRERFLQSPRYGQLTLSLEF